MHVVVMVAGLVMSLAMFPLPAGATNDPSFSLQWALPIIGAPQAWSATTGAGVRIGIVDAGVDLTHEDLAGKVVDQISCVDSGGDPLQCKGSGQDDLGHGTHVAGIAAALKDNGLGVAGVAPDAALVVAKVGDAQGRVNLDDANAGIRWVVDHGARVVNLSFGDLVFLRTAAFGTALADGIDYAWSHGAVPVLASGNTDLFGLGVGSSDYGDLNAIVVGATGPDDQVTGYSSPTGSAKWAIVAPGGAADGTEADDIYSTFWVDGEHNQYGYLAGTSMAAPFVSGAVALLLAQGLGPQEAVDRILATANPSVDCGPNSPTCKGRLDVARAVGAKR
jgi:thermitase